MIGLVVQFLLSYILIYWTEKGNLSVLGLKPNQSRIAELLLYALIAGFCSSVTFLLRMLFANESWILNPTLDWKLFINGAWYNFKSVLYEELIFRGVIFYLLIKKWGGTKAIFISATAFGIYHWFTYEIFNDPVKMMWIFLITFSAGFVYALGYYRTKSLYAPIGMHFGWNFVQSFIFSGGNTGPGMLIERLPAPQVQVSYFVYYSITFLHLVLFIVVFAIIFQKKSRYGNDLN
jgi:membrane protease YdiL (CAAX protease family)